MSPELPSLQTFGCGNQQILQEEALGPGLQNCLLYQPLGVETSKSFRTKLWVLGEAGKSWISRIMSGFGCHPCPWNQMILGLLWPKPFPDSLPVCWEQIWAVPRETVLSWEQALGMPEQMIFERLCEWFLVQMRFPPQCSSSICLLDFNTGKERIESEKEPQGWDPSHQGCIPSAPASAPPGVFPRANSGLKL